MKPTNNSRSTKRSLCQVRQSLASSALDSISKVTRRKVRNLLSQRMKAVKPRKRWKKSLVRLNPTSRSVCEKSSISSTLRFSKDTCAKRILSSTRWIKSSPSKRSCSISQTTKRLTTQDSGTSKATSSAQSKWKESDLERAASPNRMSNPPLERKGPGVAANRLSSPKKPTDRTFQKSEESKWKKRTRLENNKRWL